MYCSVNTLQFISHCTLAGERFLQGLRFSNTTKTNRVYLFPPHYQDGTGIGYCELITPLLMRDGMCRV